MGNRPCRIGATRDRRCRTAKNDPKSAGAGTIGFEFRHRSRHPRRDRYSRSQPSRRPRAIPGRTRSGDVRACPRHAWPRPQEPLRIDGRPRLHGAKTGAWGGGVRGHRSESHRRRHEPGSRGAHDEGERRVRTIGMDVHVRRRESGALLERESAVRQRVTRQRVAAGDQGCDCGDREARARAGDRARVRRRRADAASRGASTGRPAHGRDARHECADPDDRSADAGRSEGGRLHRVHRRVASRGQLGDANRQLCGRDSQSRTRSSAFSRATSARRAIRCRPTVSPSSSWRCGCEASAIRTSIAWRNRILRDC